MEKYVYIFDIDGVITNPQTKKVKESKILKAIAGKLKNGNPVIFNTGRSLKWVSERVLGNFLKEVKNKEDFKNFLVIGEFGAVWLTIDLGGNVIYGKDEFLVISEQLSSDVKKLIEERFSESMMFDDTKETMISTEMRDNYSLEKYRAQQKKLEKMFRKLLEKYKLEHNLQIHLDTIAVNIMSDKQGKDFAIERILEWLRDRKVAIGKFIAVGDNRPDLQMGKKLAAKGLKVKFVFVGDDSIDVSGYNFPIILTKNKYDRGTLEFLESVR